MADDIVTEQPTTGAPAHTTTIIRESRSSSGTGIIMGLVLLVVVIGGLYLFSRITASETAKDNAVTAAANNVGDAASKVGDAAQDAVSTSK